MATQNTLDSQETSGRQVLVRLIAGMVGLIVLLVLLKITMGF